MHPSDMHSAAQSVFARVLADVADHDLAAPTPCSAWTVADLIAHVTETNEWAVERMGGSAITGSDDDRLARHRAAAAGAIAVFTTPGWDEQLVEVPFGRLPAPVFATIRAGDVYTHAWDLASAIGHDTDLGDELGEAILAATAPAVSDDLRGDGRPFGPEQPCPPDRPAADRLAAFLGRTITAD